MDDAMVAAVGAHLPLLKNALAPYDSGREYLNFAEHSTEAGRIWPDDVLARLHEVKAEYDPDDMFRSNHPLA
jgi:hypothetical protein